LLGVRPNVQDVASGAAFFIEVRVPLVKSAKDGLKIDNHHNKKFKKESGISHSYFLAFPHLLPGHNAAQQSNFDVWEAAAVGLQRSALEFVVLPAKALASLLAEQSPLATGAAPYGRMKLIERGNTVFLST
jgi:hypothetical protein